MNIRVDLTTFYSMGDERRFFQGVGENPAISKVRGIGRQLEMTLTLNRLNKERLRDLIALLWRYGIPLVAFSQIAEKPRFAWLNDEHCFWYKSMFGSSPE
jgi:hypothetical protein